VVHVAVPDLAWSESQLETKLIRNLSRFENGRVLTSGAAAAQAAVFPEDYNNLDSLVHWGREVGCRHVLLVEIRHQGLETRKPFSLPLVAHVYQRFGVIQGELRLVDVSKRAFVIAEPFEIERKGPRIFQATMDDDINDPDIHLTAPRKLRFFDDLEEELATDLTDRVSRAVRLR
jgi:hypothetical protein